nr:immunoglobulin heavy chain junction region [Mus musculus]
CARSGINYWYFDVW